ncbi:hypothetical protein [Vibrio superstes]|uniref:hypothetical protein n=1 Tax=Vibrio superstes TaxID=198815 RepID=UPI0011BE809C|nr:hypothetical protein [Vibrio superstes]
MTILTSLKTQASSFEPQDPHLNHRHSGSVLAGIFGCMERWSIRALDHDDTHEPQDSRLKPQAPNLNHRHSGSLLAGIFGFMERWSIRALDHEDTHEPQDPNLNYRHSGSLLAGIFGCMERWLIKTFGHDVGLNALIVSDTYHINTPHKHLWCHQNERQ